MKLFKFYKDNKSIKLHLLSQSLNDSYLVDNTDQIIPTSGKPNWYDIELNNGVARIDEHIRDSYPIYVPCYNLLSEMKLIGKNGQLLIIADTAFDAYKRYVFNLTVPDYLPDKHYTQTEINVFKNTMEYVKQIYGNVILLPHYKVDINNYLVKLFTMKYQTW